MNILEELWEGKINPCEQFVREDSEYFSALRKGAAETERFLTGLPAELREKLEKLLDVQMEAAAVAERNAFVMGFRMAVQVMMESLHKLPAYEN